LPNDYIEAWRIEVNTERPHSSLGNRTPQEYATDWTKKDVERVVATTESNAISDQIGCQVEIHQTEMHSEVHVREFRQRLDNGK
jgi:hypothetical protein